MKAKAPDGQDFETNKVFTDRWSDMSILYSAPQIPLTLANKLKIIGQLGLIKEVLDGIKDLKAITDILKTKTLSDWEAFGKKTGRTGKRGYSSGIPWDVFNRNGEVGFGISEGHPGNASSNPDGSVTFTNDYNSDGIDYWVQTNINPNGQTNTTTTQRDNGGTNGGKRITVSHSSSTQNSNGTPDDYEFTESTTDVATGRQSVTTLTVKNGSNVGVVTNSDYDEHGNVINRTENKVNVKYGDDGIPSTDPAKTPSDEGGTVTPAQQEQLWQSMPWLADMFYLTWEREYIAAIKKSSIVQPPIGNNNSSVNSGSYHFDRNIIINWGEGNECFPIGRIPVNPKQNWRNIIHPPPIPH